MCVGFSLATRQGDSGPAPAKKRRKMTFDRNIWQTVECSKFELATDNLKRDTEQVKHRDSKPLSFGVELLGSIEIDLTERSRVLVKSGLTSTAGECLQHSACMLCLPPLLYEMDVFLSLYKYGWLEDICRLVEYFLAAST